MQSNSFGRELPGIQVAFISAIILAFTFTILTHLNWEIADEGFHTPKIKAFLAGNFEVKRDITMLPGYHAVMAALLKISGIYSLHYARFLHVLLTSLAIPILYFICKRLHQENSDTRTLMYLFCPIALPFFSLIYTDMPAVLAILAMTLATLHQRYIIAGIMGLIAVTIRQPSLVWVGFCGTLIIVQHYEKDEFRTLLRLDKKLWHLFLKLLPLGCVVLAALVFFYFNKGIAIGDHYQHTVSLNLSNLYHFLLIGFLIFLPYNVAYAKDIFKLFHSRPILWAVLAVLFAVFMITYINVHPYNAPTANFFLRNIVLNYSLSTSVLKALTFIPVIWTALMFTVLLMKSDKKIYLALVYVFSLASFVPLPLVEPRYFLAGIALFLAFKPKTDVRLDMTALFLYIPLNCVLLYYISKFKTFI